ncbi:dihydrolipoyl dehydrogenase [Aquibacillus salsiterrae]|uniref:Dihydrolipoyl dehydrogenase n=1 Tax=Aquibacillus salsiterrae TaxID=2950439 RepID=A0A9X3WBB5_9BACI|nr:dihydrolipoyl dehydrogenase [Aquibacillus salsiterrae]MDC3415468.1 dihydrolipoyl dehydrogenase [Aquibacillus salsiterrae]
MAKEYDLVILGGGTGGYVAAIRASQLGLKTAIVERDKLGGTCLHKGCIPSKSLLRSAEVLRQSKESDTFGVEIENISLNYTKVQARKNAVVESLHKGVQALVNQAKVDVFYGNGTILGPSIFSPNAGTVSVQLAGSNDNELLVPKYLLIATGSKARGIPELDVDGDRIIYSDHALDLKELPQSIIIVGGGVIGIEWASMLSDFGVEVSIVEAGSRILPSEDKHIAKEMDKRLKKKGVSIFTNATLDQATVEITTNVKAEVVIEKGRQSIEADKLLIAIGREPNTSNVGIENTDVKLDSNRNIETNEFYQTNEEHIYAIGDVIGGMQLAHVSTKEALIAVEHIAGLHPYRLDYLSVPTCVYAHPEIARVGLTEEEAKEKGYQVKTAKVSFQAIGKALVYGESDGFVKMIADVDSNDLLGVHMIGPHVTDLISEVGLAKILDASPFEISESIHPHPSLSEIIGEVAFAIEGKRLHG